MKQQELDIKGKVDYVLRAKGLDPNQTHLCHYPGCRIPVKPAFWGCQSHWYALPRFLRSMIWATYKAGQEITKDPSPAYLDVAEKVQIWIQAHAAWRTIEPLVRFRTDYSENLGVAHLPL